MTWDDVEDAMVAALTGDPALVAELGGPHVYAASASRAVTIPSVTYSRLSDREVDSLNPLLYQIDYFAQGVPSARIIERRIRTVLHSDVRRTFAGSDCRTTYEDSRDHGYPDQKIVHRSLDFRMEPVRERYVVS